MLRRAAQEAGAQSQALGGHHHVLGHVGGVLDAEDQQQQMVGAQFPAAQPHETLQLVDVHADDEVQRRAEGSFALAREQHAVELRGEGGLLPGAHDGFHDFVAGLLGLVLAHAGSLVWNARQSRMSIAEIRKNFLLDARDIFSSLLQSLDKKQLSIIKQILKSKYRPRDFDNTLTNLQFRGILTEDNQLFCAPFADYVLGNLMR